MKKYLALILVLACSTGWAQKKTEVSSKDLKEYVTFLASDSLKGRKPGTKEADVAAAYILQHFKEAGLKPLADGGFQYFEVVTDVTLGEANSLTFGDFQGTLKKDFTPLAFSSPGNIGAAVAFAGYGFNIDTDSLKWNDYRSLDANGKWVMVFRADPELDNQESRFIPYSDVRSKVLTAKDNGAAGILLVSPSGLDKEDKLMPLVVENNEVTAGIPVIHIRREVADAILKATGYTADSLESLIAIRKEPLAFQVNTVVKASVDITQKKENTENVVAVLEGSDPVLKNEYLVIGGHYDHLGFGGPNSGSRMPDTVAVHNGADDNASGTAMVMELAGRLAAQQSNLRRSIIFVAFSAEEMGLLGSKYFVNNCPVDLKSIKAMFNFDMVGRFDKEKNSISVSGTGTSLESDSIIRIHEKGLPFEVVHAADGYGPSDHASFYASGIPVFYFNTGVHMDYHTPFDDADKLDYETEKRVGDFAESIILDVDNLSTPLTFRQSGSRDQAGRGGRRLKVTLGIMPDFAGTEKRGLRIDGVTKDGPADRGGMKKGDIIISMNGMPVGNIYEYMSRLSKLKHGMTVNVEVIRNEKTEILLVQL